MALALGKRKRITREQLEQPSRSPTPSTDSEQSDGEDIQDIFRKAFEAKFKPLEGEAKKQKIETVEDVEEELDNESDWSGISSEDSNKVEVFSYTNTLPTSSKASKAETKAFMSSKPPTSSTLLPPNPRTTKPSSDPEDSTHLKNDIALQRLLRDSHLLSTSTPTSTSTSGTSTPTTTKSLSATGSTRHKSTDLHLLSLGAKSSIHTQKSMPMSHRKGIALKARQREDKRRAEARENGVILEKAVKVRKFNGERERGVGGPGVGKFRGGMLRLSKRDVADINRGDGVGGSGRGKGKGRGTGKGKRGGR